MATQTPRQMASNQQRTLAAMKARLIEMSIAWSDVDGYFERLLEELSDRVAETQKELGRRD